MLEDVELINKNENEGVKDINKHQKRKITDGNSAKDSGKKATTAKKLMKYLDRIVETMENKNKLLSS